VKLDKLLKQIQREAAANPKKVALLGLMLLVALYFWAPMTWRWLEGANGKKSVKTLNASLILTDDPAEPAASGKGGSSGKFRWEKVRQSIRSDPHMLTADFDSTWVDPFAPRAQPVPVAPSGSAAVGAETTAAVVGPHEAGLSLTSIAIGPRSRSATISGDTYHENQTIVVGSKDNSGVKLEFQVVRIDRLSVELERGGRKFVLELTRPKLGSGDDIRPAQQKHGE
jgi:hypothetical protein